MPSAVPSPILPPSVVAVTGANGFIAQHCIATLLSEGYRVVGTVRSESRIQQVLDTHGGNLKLSVVVVEDITSVESYLSALRPSRPEAVLHLAAPFHYNTSNFEKDLMIPAIKGSTAILDAAQQLRTVKRIVHTNSFAGIYDAAKGAQPDKTYTAKDWSPLTYEDGVRAPAAAVAYRASKAVAERAAWQWMEEHTVNFDLVGLNPGMVFGSFLPGALPPSLKQLNTSNQIIWDIVSIGQNSEIPPTRAPVWVSVRDAALAHVKALQVPEASGERFLLAAGVYCNQEIADVARNVAGDLKSNIPRGTPGLREVDTHFGIDASKTERCLGMKWQGMEDMLTEVVPQLFSLREEV